MLAHRQLNGHAGEQAISVSVMSTQVLALRKNRSPRRNSLARPLPRYVTAKAGFEPALSLVRSIRNLHHQRWLSRKTRQTRLQKNDCGALNGAAIANPARFALPSVSGLRLVPSGRPRAFEHAPLRREPRDPGLPFRLAPGYFERAVLFSKTKNPPERPGSGGSVSADCRFRLGETAPMSRACAIDWPQAIRQSDEFFVPVLHHSAHVGREPNVRGGRGKYA
jgi:hypothetical protein